jgi:hypothetical protein
MNVGRKFFGAWIVISALWIVAACPAHSMTIAEYASRKSEKNIAFYVAGVGAGYYYAMNTAKAMGLSRLYCPADGPGPSGEFYNQLLNQHLDSQGSNIDPRISIEVLLLSALIQRFPCR